MDSYRFYANILLLGDNSKYDFINSILNEELSKENDGLIEISNGKNFREEVLENGIKILSPNIQRRKKLYLANNLYDVLNSFEEVDKAIIFSTFPYNKEDIIDECKSIMKEIDIKELLVVIYKERRGFGCGDIGNEDENIMGLIETFKSNNIRVVVRNSWEDNEELLNISPNLINSFINDYKGTVIKAKEKFNGNFDSDYNFNVVNYVTRFSILNPKEFEKYNNIFEYSRIRVFEDIWSAYVTLFTKDYLYGKDGIIDNSLEFYKNYIGKISFWGINEDLNNLRDKIIDGFNNYFGSYKEYPMVGSELEYIRFLNKSQGSSLKILFKKRVEGFLNKVLKEIIRNEVDLAMNKVKINEEGENEVNNINNVIAN
ncbi:MAG: hypothetical protein ACRC7N_05820 [Clostridium sp.]